MSVCATRQSSFLRPCVDGCEPRFLCSRQEEMRIGHLQRLKNSRRQITIERHSSDLLDDMAKNVGRVAVDVTFARLRLERQRSELLDPVADGLGLIGKVPL